MCGRVSFPTFIPSASHIHSCHQGQLHCVARARYRACSSKSCQWVRNGITDPDFCIQCGPVMYNPWISTWCSSAAWTMDIPVFSGDTTSHGHQHQFLLLYSQGLRHCPQQQLRLGPHHGSRWLLGLWVISTTDAMWHGGKQVSMACL